jgi:predicted GIY-YIG superfamily endonuclease
MFYTYILYSPTIKKFYIGVTSNVEQRIHYHTVAGAPSREIKDHGISSILRRTKPNNKPSEENEN